MYLGHIFQGRSLAKKPELNMAYSLSVHSGWSRLPSTSPFQLQLSSALPFLQLISLLPIILPTSFALRL